MNCITKYAATVAVAAGLTLAGAGVVQAAPNAKCEAAARNGTTAVLESKMCNPSAASSSSGEAAPEQTAPSRPQTQLQYDPQERIDGERFMDFAIVPSA